MPVNLSTRYRSREDASMRHSGTYIGIYDPSIDLIKPYYVRSVEGDSSNPILNLRSITNEEEYLDINMQDSALVSDRPTLGLVNLRCSRTNKIVATWFEAHAARQIKRSLDFNHINSHTISLHPLPNDVSLRVIVNDNINREKSVSTFFNKLYPSFLEAYEEIVNLNAVSIAFSPKFSLAISRTSGIIIMYKELQVGWLEGMTPTLAPSFSYLVEQLMENIYGDA
jgi:hypothetical protein